MSYWPDQRPSSPYLPPSQAAAPQRSQAPESGPPQRYDRGDEEVSERTARLMVTFLAVSFTVLIIGLVVFFTVKTLRQREQGVDTPVIEAPVTTTPEDAARIVGGIGPPPGADVVSYTNVRKEALTSATGNRLAVVSLGAYATEAKARSLVAPAEIVALLAAAPGGQPAVVTGTLAAWANTQTAEARAEREEIQKLIPTAQNDPQFQAFYRSEVDRLSKLINAIKPNGDLVFAVVVRGPVPTLQQLGAKPEVRLVDVAPTADPDPKSAYRGLRPEEKSKANEPNTRPL